MKNCLHLVGKYNAYSTKITALWNHTMLILEEEEMECKQPSCAKF